MAGIWKALVHQPPFNASTMLLLTDGTIMCQESGGVRWWRLRPDTTGNYVNGTWSELAPMHHTRLYYASAVLADGRVLVAGGEYSDAGSETNTAEMYNPITNTWTVIPGPPGWAQIGDAACCVLPDGRFLLGSIGDVRTALYDPTTGIWSAGPNKHDRSSEESWSLLPDHSVLAAECTAHPKAEKYVPSAGAWVSAGTTPVDLVEASSIEIGPSFLLPDGRAFFIGATNHTALYTMSATPTLPGTWAIGPSFPVGPSGQPMGAKDAPGCLMPNGNVLCVAGPVDGVSGHYLGPTSFFEFDGVALHKVSDPPNAAGVPFVGRMMLTPAGQVLFAAGTPAMYAYFPSGGPHPSWRPHITGAPGTVTWLGTHTLSGTQLNGLSQAVGYGDDAASATNYPIVRLENLATGKVTYCRTHNHSTMGVATGSVVHTTQFTVPFGAALGASELVVIANGIASAPVTVTVKPFIFHFPVTREVLTSILADVAETPQWVLTDEGASSLDPGTKGKQAAEIAREVQYAHRQIAEALGALEALGGKVVAAKRKAAEAILPAVDPELSDGEDDDGKAVVAGYVVEAKAKAKSTANARA
ncbi:MAG TPA: kelch repeat-containing protein [Thermomicrobiales bacterium]